MRIPIGISDFKELIQDVSSENEHYLYCDKSMMIKDIIDDGAKVLLFTRPRRFGKTLNMSMLYYFFGARESLFDGLQIAKNQYIMDTYHGKYPVVSISFKGLKHKNYQDMFGGLSHIIRDAFAPYKEIFHNSGYDVYFDRTVPMTVSDMGRSLLILSQKLHAHYGQRVLVLIDEYDAPIQTGYLNEYYEEIVAVLRNLFEDGLKDNSSLYKGVLTGITRVAKANLFSGLNHFYTYDINVIDYAQYFGFTEDDVKAMIPEHYQDAKKWYNGYTFGNRTIYNPWSILNFIKNYFEYKAYWIDTAENSLIQKSLTADKMEAVEKLMNGGTFSLKIDNNLVLKYLKEDRYAFFNLLYTSGYLTSAGDGPGRYEKLVRIPNYEVHEFFETTVLKWFGYGQGDAFLDNFLADLIYGRAIDLQTKLQDLILNTMSFHDVGENTQESFYHGFLLGITLGLKGRYHVNSNRESGYGRYDIALYPNDPSKDPGVIIEVKMNKESADQALLQIQDKEYATELKRHGCKTILLYGLHFDGKTVSTKLVTA
ncbi:MAG: AAA family ATPase [Pseudomonadota bacterium]